MSFVAFPQAARKNLIADFTADLQEEFNETEKFAQSFASVALDWLGYDDDERIVFVDGSNDRGLEHRTNKWTHHQRPEMAPRIAEMQSSPDPTSRPML